ncbi:NME NM23 member 5, partial [Rhizophlyctis rosea]
MIAASSKPLDIPSNEPTPTIVNHRNPDLSSAEVSLNAGMPTTLGGGKKHNNAGRSSIIFEHDDNQSDYGARSHANGKKHHAEKALQNNDIFKTAAVTDTGRVCHRDAMMESGQVTGKLDHAGGAQLADSLKLAGMDSSAPAPMSVDHSATISRAADRILANFDWEALARASAGNPTALLLNSIPQEATVGLFRSANSPQSFQQSSTVNECTMSKPSMLTDSQSNNSTSFSWPKTTLASSLLDAGIHAPSRSAAGLSLLKQMLAGFDQTAPIETQVPMLFDMIGTLAGTVIELSAKVDELQRGKEGVVAEGKENEPGSAGQVLDKKPASKYKARPKVDGGKKERKRKIRDGPKKPARVAEPNEVTESLSVSETPSAEKLTGNEIMVPDSLAKGDMDFEWVLYTTKDETERYVSDDVVETLFRNELQTEDLLEEVKRSELQSQCDHQTQMSMRLEQGPMDMEGDDPVVRKLRKEKWKLFQFAQEIRPPYWGTFSKRSAHISGRRPFGKDPNLNYDVDSADEWEEEEPGEELRSDGEEEEGEELRSGGKEPGEEEQDEDDGFIVKDGYLSEDEGGERDEDCGREFAVAKRQPIEPLIPLIIGPIFDDDEKPHPFEQYRIIPLTDLPGNPFAKSETDAPSKAEAPTRQAPFPEETLEDLKILITECNLSLPALVAAYRKNNMEVKKAAVERMIREIAVREKRPNDAKARWHLKINVEEASQPVGTSNIANALQKPKMEEGAGISEPPTIERACALIKPDAYGAGHKDAILEMIVKNGLRVVKQKEVKMTREMGRQFYREHEGKAFFEDLVGWMSSAPVYAMILERENAILTWGDLAGPTNSNTVRETAPTSSCHRIRAKYGTDETKNAVHASESAEAYRRDFQFLFVPPRQPKPDASDSSESDDDSQMDVRDASVPADGNGSTRGDVDDLVRMGISRDQERIESTVGQHDHDVLDVGSPLADMKSFDTQAAAVPGAINGAVSVVAEMEDEVMGGVDVLTGSSVIVHGGVPAARKRKLAEVQGEIKEKDAAEGYESILRTVTGVPDAAVDGRQAKRQMTRHAGPSPVSPTHLSPSSAPSANPLTTLHKVARPVFSPRSRKPATFSRSKFTLRQGVEGSADDGVRDDSVSEDAAHGDSMADFDRSAPAGSVKGSISFAATSGRRVANVAVKGKNVNETGEDGGDAGGFSTRAGGKDGGGGDLDFKKIEAAGREGMIYKTAGGHESGCLQEDDEE